MATEREIEAVARELCRIAVLRDYSQGDATPDLPGWVEKTWSLWKIEAEAAIEAYEKARGSK